MKERRRGAGAYEGEAYGRRGAGEESTPGL